MGEITNCACVVESDNGMYCQEWDCQENRGLTDAYSLSRDDLDELESETYTCRKASSSGLYCDQWTAIIVGRTEFELSRCRVKSVDSNSGKPNSWTCYEEGFAFWRRVWAAVFICCPIGVFFTIFLGVRMMSENRWIAVIILVSSWLANVLICTMCAGLAGFLVTLAFYIPAAIVVAFCMIKNRSSY